MRETGGLELALTITLVLKANRLTKCASHPKKFESMLVLLSDDSEQSTAIITNLPNNQEVMKSISNFLPPQKTNWIGDIIVNHLCVTL